MKRIRRRERKGKEMEERNEVPEGSSKTACDNGLLDNGGKRGGESR